MIMTNPVLFIVAGPNGSGIAYPNKKEVSLKKPVTSFDITGF